MSESLDQEIRTLRALYWSTRDPEGRGFAPLAEAYRRKGDLDEAFDLVRDGLGRLPDFTTGHLVAARVAYDREDREEAAEHLERLLALDSENVTALVERAGHRLADGDRDGAEGDLKSVLGLEPGHTEAAEALERLRGLEGHEAESIDLPAEDVGESFEGGPDLEEAAFTLEDIPEAATGAEEPGAELEEIAVEPEEIAVEPDEPAAAFEEIAAEPEEIAAEPPVIDEPVVDDAVEEIAVDEGPDRSLFTRTMGELYARQGLLDRAIEVFEHLVDQAPDDPGLAARLEELRAEAVAGAAPSVEAVPQEPEPAFSDLETTEPEEPAESLAADAPAAAPSAGAARTIANYLDDLLAWQPGAVPIDSLAPEGDPSVESSGRSGGAPSDGDPSGESPDEDVDEFNQWLDGLQT